VRMALWPLGWRERTVLRVVSMLFSPILWLTVLLLLLRATVSLAAVFVGAAVAIQVVGAATGRTWHVVRAIRVPRFPGGWGGLVTANVRQMLTVLDPYLALILALGGTLWRLLDRRADPDAFPVLSLLVAVALSTYAQCLFGLDSAAAMARYRLLPLRGWRILLAKDAAFLLVLLFLVLPLSPAHGVAFGLAALAVGRYPALCRPLPQHRWRLTSGRVLYAVPQGVVGCMLGFQATNYGGAPLGAAAAIYLVSLYLGGRVWDRRVRATQA